MNVRSPSFQSPGISPKNFEKTFQPKSTKFGTILNQVLGNREKPDPEALPGTSRHNSLHVSSHAEKRLTERKIEVDENVKKTLSEAIDELSAKGATNSLIVTPNAIFVVNIPSRTLITALDPAEMRNRVITQIDSVSIKPSR